MTCRLVAAAALLVCGSGTALAERGIDVAIDAVAPFDRAQLAAAIRLRLPADGPRVAVRVTQGANGLQVETGGGVREVAIAGLGGIEAARLVALAIDDLALDDRLAHPVPRERAARPPRTFSLLGAFGDHALPAYGAVASLAYPRGRWLVAFDGGLTAPATEMLTMTTATLRAGAGVRAGWLEVRAGLTLMPIRVDTGVGDLSVLAGFGASVRARIPVTPSLRAVVAAGADAFVNPTRYQLNGADVLSTGWLIPWLGLGVEVPL